MGFLCPVQRCTAQASLWISVGMMWSLLKALVVLLSCEGKQIMIITLKISHWVRYYCADNKYGSLFYKKIRSDHYTSENPPLISQDYIKSKDQYHPLTVQSNPVDKTNRKT